MQLCGHTGLMSSDFGERHQVGLSAMSALSFLFMPQVVWGEGGNLNG